jgi:hypothetical protein
VSDEGEEWRKIKESIISKIKDLDSNTITNLLVLSTVGKDRDVLEVKADLFDSIESELILKMKPMVLPDLINLMWSAKEINKGSDFFFKRLEEEITARIR